jgi:hypothetical protein
MAQTITVDVALAVLMASGAAHWVKIIIDAKKTRRDRERQIADDAKQAVDSLPRCAAAQLMVKEHIELLATHSAEIGSLQANLGDLRKENRDDHEKICIRLDKIIANGHGRPHEN